MFLAKGAEEMETVDTLRRADIDVTLVGVESAEPVLCSRNVTIVPDKALSAVAQEVFDTVIVPGGLKGAETCANVILYLFFHIRTESFVHTRSSYFVFLERHGRRDPSSSLSKQKACGRHLCR